MKVIIDGTEHEVKDSLHISGEIAELDCKKLCSQCCKYDALFYNVFPHVGKISQERIRQIHKLFSTPMLLRYANKGDIAIFEDGTYKQITEVIDGIPKLWKTGHLEFFVISGEAYNICTKTNENKIVKWESLAKESTPEWAWQMIMLGKEVSNGINCHYKLYDGDIFISYIQENLEYWYECKNQEKESFINNAIFGNIWFTIKKD